MNPSRLLNRWQQLPEAEIRRFQAEKLRHYLRTVVLPFSPHYRELFREYHLNADRFHTLDDLQLLPFTKKSDLLPTPEQPERFKEFILSPDAKVLARRPETLLRAAFYGRKKSRQNCPPSFVPSPCSLPPAARRNRCLFC